MTISRIENERIINGRLYIVGKDDIAHPFPLSRDESRAFKGDLSNKPSDYVIRNGKEYEIIDDAEQYTSELAGNNANVVSGTKSGGVIARKGTPGEPIVVYTNNGNIEATESCGENKWILTRADDKGKPVIDKYGHDNSWQISEETLKERYDVKHMTKDGFVRPISSPQTFIQVDKDIAVMKPWGPNGSMIPQTLDKGGYLNITNKDDIYAIAAAELKETYNVKKTRELPDIYYGDDKTLENDLSR